MTNLRIPYFKKETFGAVDGPGVRLIIFTQGCSYRCIYCHNPESWALKSKEAKMISVDEIIAIYNDNITFYRNGGITISGGDPLIHIDFMIELAKKCHEQDISLALDTSGVNFCEATKAKYLEICKYNPLWIVDVKHINPDKHELITGVKEQREVKLIEFLDEHDQSMWVRQVLIPGYTDDENDLKKLGKFIYSLKNLKRFELLPYHNLGEVKYEQLGIKYPLKNAKIPTKNDIEKAMKNIRNFNIL